MVSRRSDRSLRRCECPTTHTGRVIRRKIVRACLKIAWGPAARDFGCGQGGEAGASPQRAVTAEPTKATGKRPAARRVFEEKAGWLRCSSVGDRCGYPPSSRLAIRPFPRKQDSHGIFRQALSLRPDSKQGSRIGFGPPLCRLRAHAGQREIEG